MGPIRSIRTTFAFGVTILILLTLIARSASACSLAGPIPDWLQVVLSRGLATLNADCTLTWKSGEVTNLNGNLISLTVGDAISGIGLVLAISVAAALSYAKMSRWLVGASMKRGAVMAALGIVLTCVSLLNAQHVVGIGYDAVNYGYPLPWLIHYFMGIAPVNLWLPSVVGLAADFLLYLVVSAVFISSASMLTSSRLTSAP